MVRSTNQYIQFLRNSLNNMVQLKFISDAHFFLWLDSDEPYRDLDIPMYGILQLEEIFDQSDLHQKELFLIMY